MGFLRKAGWIVGLGSLVLVAVLVGRALLLPVPSIEVARVDVPVDEQAIAQRLGEAIQFATVSPGPPAQRDPAPFHAYLDWLREAYPRLHQELQRDVLGDLSVLFTWPGTDSSAPPILLTAHYDVVPVIPGTEDEWVHPPFSGVVEDGFVWGRGALDDKSAMIALLDATTVLLEQGFRPRRTVYLAFGHDEEIGGAEGAGAIAEHLRSQGVRLAWSLDEGSFLTDGLYPGIDVPVASINVAEKGYLTLDLVARGEGGHSSIPPSDTTIGTLAAALLRLQENPLPGGIDGVTADSFDALTPHMSFWMRVLMANRWLFGGLVESRLRSNPGGNAVLGTTTAPTMLEAGVKENVLPPEAVATVNFRLHPRDRRDDVIEHVRRAVADDRVEVEIRRDGNEASPVSRTSGEGFEVVARSVREVYGPVVVAPGLTVGGTDSRHYGPLADDAYRFNPIRVTEEDTKGFHGTNERISIETLAQGTRAYVQILRNAAGPSAATSD